MGGIGRKVAQALHDGRAEGSTEAVKRRLLENLQPDLADMKVLKDNLVPAAVRKFEAEGGEVTLNTDRLHLVQDFDDSTHVEMEVSQRRLSSDVSESGKTGAILTSKKEKGMETKVEDGAALVGGLMDQSRIALNWIDYMAESFGVKLNIPWFAKSLLGAGTFAVQTGACAMRANDGGGHKGYNNVKLLMCPMKYASAAMDCVGGIDNMMGMGNAHFYKGVPGQAQTAPQNSQNQNFMAGIFGKAPASAPAPVPAAGATAAQQQQTGAFNPFTATAPQQQAAQPGTNNGFAWAR